MDQRSKLDSMLAQIIGSNHLYFQPPPTIRMSYPCIVYERNRAKTEFANNKPYSYRKGYKVTVIDKNPDSIYPDKVAQLPMCLFDRHFVADNLNHDVFIVYI